jgi:NADP-dependent 3-hydroxy acid dehydrogenase YdfG
MAEKIWFITGASRGFGHIWTEAALARGDKVAATARDTATLDDLCERFGGNILPLALDVTDHDAVVSTVGLSGHWGDHAALEKARSASGIRSNRCPNPTPSVPL